MKKKVTYFIQIILFLSAGCKVHHVDSNVEYANNYSVHKFDSNLCCCKYLTIDNAKFWQQDTLGRFGFRRIIAPLILKECNLSKVKWEKAAVFFGRPWSYNGNSYVEGKEVILFRYCTFLDDQDANPLESFKTQFFDVVIDKKDSTILKTIIHYIDG